MEQQADFAQIFGQGFEQQTSFNSQASASGQIGFSQTVHSQGAQATQETKTQKPYKEHKEHGNYGGYGHGYHGYHGYGHY